VDGLAKIFANCGDEVRRKITEQTQTKILTALDADHEKYPVYKAFLAAKGIGPPDSDFQA
jgi:hypothetical protein